MFLLRHATVAWQETFLQAAANFIRDPQSPRVSSALHVTLQLVSCPYASSSVL
jgi:hypothetical protein